MCVCSVAKFKKIKIYIKKIYKNKLQIKILASTYHSFLKTVQKYMSK